MAGRRSEILAKSAVLFAARGFHGVGMDDIGAEVGVSGPALYHHFASKDAILAELLTGISETLLAEGRRRVAHAPTTGDALSALIDWHVQFALEHPALITVQERDLASLPPPEQQRVKSLQRRYVQLWTSAIAEDAGVDEPTARTAAHAAFGLLNSTPHSARLPAGSMAAILRRMSAGAIASLASATK